MRPLLLSLLFTIGCTQPASQESPDLAGGNSNGDLAGGSPDLAGNTGGDSGSDSASPPDLMPATPTITSFAAARTTITKGTATTLTADFGGGSGTIDHAVGAVQSGVAISTGNLDATTTFTLTVRDAAGDSATQSVTVTVVDPPLIASFTAAKATLTSGESTTLDGVFSGGSGVVDNGVGSLVSGVDQNVGPLGATTVYTLTVTNAAGDTASATATITIVGAPNITSFTADHSTVTLGHAATLTAVFSGGVGSVNQGIGAVTSGTGKSTGNLSGTTTYTLTVTNAAGDVATQQLVVTAVEPPLIDSLLVGKSPITAGTATTLTASFSHGTGSINQGVGTVSSGVAVSTGNLSATTTFTLTVTNAAGDFVTQQQQVQVVAAPVITSFTAAKPTVSTNGSTTITAVFTGGNADVNQGIGSVGNNQPTPTGSLSTSTTYTLTVTNSSGDFVTLDAVVTVVPLPSISGFVAAKSPITAGHSTTLTASFTGGTGAVNQGVGPVVSAAPASTGSLTADTTFTLDVTNAAGDSVESQVSVSVVPAPSIQAFLIDSGFVKKGDVTALYALYTGGTGTVDHGVGAIDNIGDGVITPPLTQDMQWTLTVTNAAGDSATDTTPIVRVYLDQGPCKAAKIRNPSATDGLYLLDFQTLVQCDMTHDGGGWMKILQLHDQPYTPTAFGAGDITTPSPTAFAKLDDGKIASGVQEYRFEGNQSADKLFVMSGSTWNDTHQGWNLSNGAMVGCVNSDHASCFYKPFSPNPALDTLPLIEPDDDCTRFFVDLNGNSECYGISDTQRCMSAGQTCGGGFPMIQDLTIWQRETYRNHMMNEHDQVFYFPFDVYGNPSIDVVGLRVAAQGGSSFDWVSVDGTALVAPGGSALFDGNDFLWLGNEAAFNAVAPVDQQEFAAEAWFEVTGGSGYRTLISSRDDDGTNTKGWALTINPSNHLEFWTGGGDNDSWVILDGGAVTLNQRHHVVGRYDKSDKHIFLDGVDVASCTSGCQSMPSNLFQPLRIGAGGTSAPADFFVGRLDEVAFYSGFRFDVELALDHYQQGGFN